MKNTKSANGNILIKGKDLTDEQKAMIKFNGAIFPEWILKHKFWFKNGKPSTEEGYYYPVTC